MLKLPVYGLTGNIGCGKSTVLNIFARFIDVVVFDTDKIAKKLLEDKYADSLLKIVEKDVFSDNKIDFQKIDKIVFKDDQKLKELQNFIHPLVWEFICEDVKKKGNRTFGIVESAILFEINWDKLFDKIIVVECSHEQQYKRLYEKGLKKKEIESRIAKQMPIEEKRKRADIIIDTECSFQQLEVKVNQLYCFLKGGVLNDKKSSISRHF
ncbi:dephospho-CoA kinase [Patescibacteria group bacterium]